MNNPTTERTPLIIAAEINELNRQTKRMLLINAIEVGQRLKEAKNLLKHGEWLQWLKESVSYSKSTAENLMRIYEEYGPKLLASPGDNPNSQLIGNLTYTQALLLLRLPEEKREEFVVRNKVGNMTTQDLQQVIKEKSPAPKVSTSIVLKKPAESTSTLKHQVHGKEESSPASNTPVPAHNLKTTSDPNALMEYVKQCDTCREIIANTFWELMTALKCLADIDPEVKEEKRKEARELAQNLFESLKEWPPPIRFITN